MNESDDERRKALLERLEKCSETVNRVMVSLLTVSLFCLFTTFGTPDRSLVTPEATIKIPFADVQMSFVGFLIVAPLLLVVLTIYLHMFYGYWRQLDEERRGQSLSETYPTLFSIDRWAGRLLTAFIFYWLTPIVIAAITWKSAARFEWGLPLALVTVLLTLGVVSLGTIRGLAGRSPRRRVLLLGVTALLSVAVVLIGVVRYRDFDLAVNPKPMFPDLPSSFNPRTDDHRYWERPLDLFRADLRGSWLAKARLVNADLRFADLRETNLAEADLRGANLRNANAMQANLDGANLSKARLDGANLSKASLHAANFTGASLSGASLVQAKFYHTDFRGAYLGSADLSGTIIVSADFTESSGDMYLRGTMLLLVKGLTCDRIHSSRTNEMTRLPKDLECPKPTR